MTIGDGGCHQTWLACDCICKVAGSRLENKALIVGISVQAIWVTEISDLGQSKVGCQLIFDKDRRALEAAIRVLLENGCMVAARILAAVHHGLDNWNQLGI